MSDGGDEVTVPLHLAAQNSPTASNKNGTAFAQHGFPNMPQIETQQISADAFAHMAQCTAGKFHSMVDPRCARLLGAYGTAMTLSDRVVKFCSDRGRLASECLVCSMLPANMPLQILLCWSCMSRATGTLCGYE